MTLCLPINCVMKPGMRWSNQVDLDCGDLLDYKTITSPSSVLYPWVHLILCQNSLRDPSDHHLVVIPLLVNAPCPEANELFAGSSRSQWSTALGEWIWITRRARPWKRLMHRLVLPWIPGTAARMQSDSIWSLSTPKLRKGQCTSYDGDIENVHTGICTVAQHWHVVW